MGNHYLQVPCSALFLLLVLQPLPCGRADGLKYKGPGWKLLHRLGLGRSSNTTSLESKGHSCQGIFDLYFILDKSGSVDNNWFEIYSFVENLVTKYQNSRVRISFILYSTDATILLPLTSDRQEIRQGLNKLQQVVPVGHTYMQEGFKKAIQQIENAKLLANVSSVIIALTDGTLLPDAFEATKKEAQKARKLGSIIYTVGVLEYNRDQLLAIADTPEHMFGVQNGFKGLQSITDSLSTKSCIEARSVELSTPCAGEPYEVVVSGHGFQNAKHLSQVVCRFKFNNNILGHSLLLHAFNLPPDISILFTQDPGQRCQLSCHEPQLHTGSPPCTDLPPLQSGVLHHPIGALHRRTGTLRRRTGTLRCRTGTLRHPTVYLASC
ncbi:anthrax toxin receptor-like [Perognathus longimembris pacificus]|uniref:anthrax toxin receptor-like n=1 Tax=Perognathus longimembris pacificus TaxID=214514 RepID=UPI0020191823|nr:anthrax toxin receptor-like [Perognathus longimembris pacificus]